MTVRHQTCVLNVGCENFKYEVLWGTMAVNCRTTVDRLVLWVLRQMERSLIFQMELAKKALVYVRRYHNASPNPAANAQPHQSHGGVLR